MTTGADHHDNENPIEGKEARVYHQQAGAFQQIEIGGLTGIIHISTHWLGNDIRFLHPDLRLGVTWCSPSSLSTSACRRFLS